MRRAYGTLRAGGYAVVLDVSISSSLFFSIYVSLAEREKHLDNKLELNNLIEKRSHREYLKGKEVGRTLFMFIFTSM